jgi:hypothetical protein
MAQINKSADELSLTNINQRPALSGWPMVIFWIAMIIFACHASSHMVGAGDTWVALACGRHFVDHGVTTVEPFSANSHHAGPTDEDLKEWPKWITTTFSPETIRYWHPTGWINQNWLTHVIFYELVERLGSPGKPYYDALVIWKFLIYLIAVAVVFYTGKYLGANPAISAVFACLAMFVGRSFLDIRPAGFSNLLVGMFMLILVLTTYRNVLYIWLIVPIIVLWCNLHGGYLYAFIMLAPFIVIHLLLSVPKRWFVPVYAVCSAMAVAGYIAKAYLNESQNETTFYTTFLLAIGLAAMGLVFYFLRPRAITIGIKGVVYAVIAGTLAFVGMIIFNPFHLTNLTHTYVISISKHAEQWRTVNEWHSAWEWSNPVGTSYPFLVMFIISIVIFVLWLLNWLLKPQVQSVRQKVTAVAAEFEWPKMDIAIIVIATLSIYMAIASRRFIPIAAIAACPVIAALLDQVIRMVAARISTPAGVLMSVPVMPHVLRQWIIAFAVIGVVGFGGFWGTKFYRIYLAPMADDDEYHSVFMRMTASYAKPFKAGAFMRDNQLSGNMFNYWTEGGFIAWMQNPDPNTGKTPLQLFMDGRAQAAYSPEKYDLWMSIMSGRPAALEPILRAGRQPTDKEVGNAISEELGKHNVWCVLMPADQFDTPLMEGLEQHPDWRVVFLTNKEKILVDIKTKAGEALFMGMLDGTTKYPNEFSRSLSAAHTLLFVKDENARKKGFDLAKRAFEVKPSQMALIELLGAARYPDFKVKILSLLKEYVDTFEQEGKRYAQKNGYNSTIIAAIIAANYLERTSNDPRLIESYRGKSEQYRKIQSEAMENSRW